MSIIQSSPVEIAARTQNRLFALYVVVLVVGGLAAALLTVLVYRANNTYQQNVKADADARIAEAGTSAAKADERSAIANAEAAKANAGLAKSNEEIARLTKEAEQAKTERAEADKQIAIAKADAAKAKEGTAKAEARSLKASAAVSRLRVTVANAEKERAEAQKALLEVQARVNNRVITPEQAEKFLAFVSRFKQRGKVTIECPNGTPETVNFGRQFSDLLIKAGWTVSFGTPLRSGGKTYFGVNFLLAVVQDIAPDHPLHHAVVMAEGFKAAGIEFGVEEVKGQVPDLVLLLIGPNFKP